MSKPPKKQAAASKAAPAADRKFEIRRPWLWLAAVVLILYAPSLRFDFTELDDSIFIRELSAYVSDISNLGTSFGRGVFHPTNDTYYRPMFLNAMILNYQLSEQDVAGYHLVNVFLHLGCVLLFFRLCRKTGLETNTSFLLALVFAVMPVLCQAVAWIPGRNDTLMALFLIPYFIWSIDYVREGSVAKLLLAGLALLAGMFTKETAVFAPAAGWLLLVVMLRESWKAKRMLVQYGVWIGAAAVYLLVRSAATLKQNNLSLSQMAQDFAERLPLIVQYLGKIFFPFNLSVFPIQEDTVYYYGIAAVIVLGTLIFLAKDRENRMLTGGLGIFLIFLLPVLIVPNKLNDQTFEHRLYLPVIGLLLALPQTAIFRNKLSASGKFFTVTAVAGIFALVNYNHQQYFKDPLTFWEQAAETSPHSAYALMMYGARIKDNNALRDDYIRKAYALNPDEKYLNFYYGLMLQEKDSMEASEKHLLKEQQRSDYYECDFYLAKVDFSRKNFPAAAAHLERYLSRDSLNGPANNNLMLLYLELKQKDKARLQMANMQRKGLPVAPQVVQQVQAMN